MTDDVADVDRAIEDYRAQLRDEAELARGDLAEIEDHLRTLIDELRGAGMPVAEAIGEAARRLGDPRQLAREHARVRSPFGARLSRARAWSAAVLLAPMVYLQLCATVQAGWAASYTLELVLAAGVLAAVAARLPWARAIVLGVTLTVVGWDVVWVASGSATPYMWHQFVACAGALAFVAPWRRHELSGSGLALALLGPAYAGAATMLALYFSAPGGAVQFVPWGPVAMIGVLAAGAGVLVRGRWAAAPAAVAAGALVLSTLAVWSLRVRMPSPELWRAMFLGWMLLGAAAAAAVAVLAWRTARSNVGTLRGVLS